MTPDQFRLFFRVLPKYRAMHPEWREGQIEFNLLCHVCDTAAAQISFTDSDPYYDDNQLSTFGATLALLSMETELNKLEALAVG